MPVIQPIQAERGLGGAPQPSVQRDMSVPRAVQGLGNALGNAAQAEQEMNLRRQQMDMKVQDFRTDQNFRQFNEGLGSIVDDASAKMDPSGQGLTTHFVEQFDKKSADFLATVPEALKPKFSELLQTSRAQWVDKVAHAEREQRYSWFRTGISESQQKLQAQVFNDPAVYDAAKADGLRAIEASGLPDAEKEALRKQWDETLALTIGERDVRDAQANPASAAGAAQRYGVPGAANETVVARIIGAESGGRANAKNPNSSASGVGQFLDSTWVETVKAHRPDIAKGKTTQQILALKNDPVLGREMTAAYIKDNAEFLHNQGIETTAGNVYLAHFLGPRGAAVVLKADPGTPISQLVDENVMQANPFLKGKSASEVAAWAAKKMGDEQGSVSIDPRLAALPLSERLKLYDRTIAAAKQGQAEIQVNARNDIDNAVTNAPVALQNTGKYDGEMPDREKFVSAYGEEEGARRHEAFQAAVETSRLAYQFGSMSEDDIRAAVTAAQPTSSGDDAALQTQQYEALVKAAEATIKAREADPATYTSRTVPSVATAWEEAQGSGDYTNAVSLMAQAQRRLGIQDMRLMPKDVALDAVTQFKNDVHSDQERLASVASLVFATSDPKARRAIFAQLVDAGLPAMAEGVMEAHARGDDGAARRLMQAVIADPKDLPRDSTTTPAMITDAIYSDVWAEGEVGNVAYGLSYGDASSMGRAQRATDLMKRSVQLRMARGEDLDTAIAGAKNDLFGDVVVYDGGAGVNAEMTVPADTDPDALTKGLSAAKEEFALALVDQRDRLLTRGDNAAADGTKAILDATTQNRMNDVLESGEFVQIGEGIGLRDPYTGSFVTDVDGVTPLTIPLDAILRKGRGATRGSATFDPRKSRASFDAGMGQIEGWAGQ